MRTFDVGSSNMQAIGYVENHSLMCSSLDAQRLTWNLGPVELVTSTETSVRFKRNKEHIYLPGIANQKAISRASNGRRGKLEKDGYLRDYVCRSLKKGWSPEQISGRMKYQKLTIYVCPETIYQYVYKSKNKENQSRFSRQTKGQVGGRKRKMTQSKIESAKQLLSKALYQGMLHKIWVSLYQLYIEVPASGLNTLLRGSNPLI